MGGTARCGVRWRRTVETAVDGGGRLWCSVVWRAGGCGVDGVRGVQKGDGVAGKVGESPHDEECTSHEQECRYYRRTGRMEADRMQGG